MSDSFATKSLRVKFTLSTNAQFAGQAANTLELTGLRVVAQSHGSGLPAWPTAQIAVYGMKLDDMNALSALAFNLEEVKRNTVKLEANSGQGWSTAFSGAIVSAFIDYSGHPEVCLRVDARALYLDSLTMQSTLSFKGSTDAAQMISALASQAGVSFVNAGVVSRLSDPYYGGTVGDQIKAICLHANIGVSVTEFKVTIFPLTGSIGNTPFVLTPDSGLVGYPVADSRGYLMVRSLYNPNFVYGGRVTIQGSAVVIDIKQPVSYNKRANGNWIITSIDNILESEKFDGAWFSDMEMRPLQIPVSVAVTPGT